MKIISCMDCGKEVNAPKRGMRKRCIPCAEKARKTIYDGLKNPSERQLLRRALQREEDISAKRGHLEAFMGLDYADQII